MVFNNNKRGQAAIEFLMTYGWMLLVVLIVGALIFSFVDFGSLLPNKLELSNNLLPDVGESSAQATTGTLGDIYVSFKYTGTKPTIVTGDSGAAINYNLGNTWCYSTEVDNSATDQSPGVGNETFRTGHVGYLYFKDCPAFDQIDAVEGIIKINLTSAERGITTPSTGQIRLAVVRSFN